MDLTILAISYHTIPSYLVSTLQAEPGLSTRILGCSFEKIKLPCYEELVNKWAHHSSSISQHISCLALDFFKTNGMEGNY